ncbi:MAG: glycosyltransferase [Synechococcus sp.]
MTVHLRAETTFNTSMLFTNPSPAIQNPTIEPRTKRLLIVLYRGNFREIYRRRQAGLGETYHGHYYSFDTLSALSDDRAEVTVLCCHAPESYREQVSDRLSFVGIGPQPRDPNAILKTIQRLQPTHLVLRFPDRAILKWAIRTHTRTAVLLADSFPTATLKQKWQTHRLVSQLNHPTVEWVGNHGVTACTALQTLGVSAGKIVPWDWPHAWAGYAAKELTPDRQQYSVLYVGALRETKGVGDLIQAIARLKAKHLSVNLAVAGRGNQSLFENMARSLNVTDRVTFLGLIEHSSVLERMRHSDVVAIPSRHEYPEGFPLTIYEALNSRTPPIASDHPMFRTILHHRHNALIFPAGNSDAIADCIQIAISQPDLYKQLSQASHRTWQTLQLPVSWGEFIQTWLDETEDGRQWLARYSLAHMDYESRSEAIAGSPVMD